MISSVNTLVMFNTLDFWNIYKDNDYIDNNNVPLYKIITSINQEVRNGDYIVICIEDSNENSKYISFSKTMEEIAKKCNFLILKSDEIGKSMVKVAKDFKNDFYGVRLYSNYPESHQIVYREGDTVFGIGFDNDVKDWDVDSVRKIVPGMEIHTGYSSLVSILYGNPRYNMDKLGVQNSLFKQLEKLLSKNRIQEPNTREGLDSYIETLKKIFPPEYRILYDTLRERFDSINIEKDHMNLRGFKRPDYDTFIGIAKYLKVDLSKVVRNRELKVNYEDKEEISLDSYFSKTRVFI